jgi:hypothetical protein
MVMELSSEISLVISLSSITSAIPLVEQVINQVPDVEIWNAVFDLVARTSLNEITPPTAFEKAVFDTPLRPSSASQRGVEQTHDEVDQRILEVKRKAASPEKEAFKRTAKIFQYNPDEYNTRSLLQNNIQRWNEDPASFWIQFQGQQKNANLTILNI